MKLRLATMEDVPQIEALIAESVNGLQAEDYTEEQRQGALGTVFGVDTQLILDGTYFVVEFGFGIVACGGWSRRKTLFGSDHSTVKDNTWLNPETDAARIRAFFVHPSWARKGLGRRILDKCEAEARACGFRRLQLMSTLTGIPLYKAHGFEERERIKFKLSNGAWILLAPMSKELSTLDDVDGKPGQ
ncbi:MAG: GNAT family N-acetyltransferase [Bryobacteraceae bacterium]